MRTHEIYVEEWAAAYGSPYLVTAWDVGDEAVTLVEDGERLVLHPGRGELGPGESIAFVDGVRRGEASLARMGADGALVRGVAGAHACGAVLCRAGWRAEVVRARVRRLAIWGGGEPVALPAVPGGWRWESQAIASLSPDAPALELQIRMRQAEGELAEELAAEGALVVIDGALNFVRSRDLPVVGYVKTHHRALLPPAQHARVPGLRAGERTSLFSLGQDRYSAYLRLTDPGRGANPWAGIVRLEAPQSPGLEAARRVADRLAALLPRFAGVPHRDPRAPQNLQPIGGLEAHLRHLLGDPALAARAVREAVILPRSA
ncbi:MAG: hypothetical protein QOK40_109 [Miltoncostaeaceae bacterium]|nr:hypothetical protein [Miltoncostaeaceae bacterium]